MSPSLSVVVPIYNVSDYLIPCLESLAAQTVADLEVVLVDDGSTDGSGSMAEEFAALGRRGRCCTSRTGDLGRARNIGLDQSQSEFVAFVDSDDLVPAMLSSSCCRQQATAVQTLSAVGCCATTAPGPFLLPSTCARCGGPPWQHIRENWPLLYDTTAWNKIYRRAFLAEHGLRFAEGIYYEDIPLTVPAHFLARSVDVLTDPVYLWRERQTANPSITQRRAETRNLVDRLAAVSSVDAFLTRTGEEEGKQRHDHKVLTLDIPLFLDVLHDGDETFREHAGQRRPRLPGGLSAQTLSGLVPLRRLQYHLISRGMLDELLAVHDFQRVPRNRGRFVSTVSGCMPTCPFAPTPRSGSPRRCTR